jgi:hypothetical protein
MDPDRCSLHVLAIPMQGESSTHARQTQYTCKAKAKLTVGIVKRQDEAVALCTGIQGQHTQQGLSEYSCDRICQSLCRKQCCYWLLLLLVARMLGRGLDISLNPTHQTMMGFLSEASPTSVALS